MARELAVDPIEAMVREFRKRWRLRYGGPACYTLTARARGRTGEVVRAVGLEEALRRVQAFMVDGCKWLVDRRHPYPAFLSMVDNYAGGNSDGKGKVARRSGFDAEQETTRAGRKPQAGNENRRDR